MVYTIDEIQRRIKPVAEKYNIPTIYLFGSYARGEATDESDVDFLVDTVGADLDGWKIGGFYESLKEVIEKQVDLVTVRALESENNQKFNLFFKENVNKERKKIYEYS
ncbi:nucleotidyltransferase [Clostridia bacterium]|nr:nucleotidyltransferase [Clostridia bacterium]